MQPGDIQIFLAAICQGNPQGVCNRCVCSVRLQGTLPGMLLAVQHVSPGNFVVTLAHQSQLDLILNILNVDGATG